MLVPFGRRSQIGIVVGMANESEFALDKLKAVTRVFNDEPALDSEALSLLKFSADYYHSFLPSFKGAKPYYQAHERGVKLIGATAHYVTADLDEGPIIEQDVARVDHSKTVDDLTAQGRDTESQVLARAVKWHSEHRVLLNGHKTVIFK